MKYLVLAFLFLCGGCAQLGGYRVVPRVAQMSVVSVKPNCKPNVSCHYRLNDEITQESVAAATIWLAAAVQAKSKLFLLEINTPGGSVGPGFELAKAIEEAPIPVVCLVDGRAASMGFYILQSCTVRVMTKRSTLMIHEPSVTAQNSGPTNDWKSIAEMLHAMREAMAWYCNRRLTSTIDEYRSRTDGGQAWWFSYMDAAKYNAVDVVVDTVREVKEGLAKAEVRGSTTTTP